MRISWLAGSVCFAITGAAPLQWRNTDPNVRYVGSKVCAACHRSIYDSYRRTDMGRALDLAQNDVALKTIVKPVTVYDRTLDRYFEVTREGGEFFQSEYQLDTQGNAVFRAKHKLEYAVGSGINGVGYLIRRDRYLFEAPLSWYTRLQKWDLSPGYESGDRAFSRPIESACIACHSGRPQVSADRPGLFGDPAFREMPIGCENCHGPGELHARERGSGHPVAKPDLTIVNPSRLEPRLAEEICINCHQQGNVSVLQPGRKEQDFRPGMYSASVHVLLSAPASRGQSPETESLEYDFEMSMSKCFRASGGRLSCLTCHNLHSQPPEALAPSVFRQKCLTCHTEQNCTAPRSDRLATTPADNCVGCHMARRNNERIPHAMLSEHRIVRRAGEPFPDEVYRQTTPDLPDIVWVNRPNRAGATALDADTVTAAYGLLAERFPQYRKLFLERVLPRLADTAHSLSEPLLEAAARQAAQNGDASGDRLAIATMQKAIAMGVTSSSTYLDLAALLKRDHLFDDAVRVLEKAQEQFPFDRGVSRSLIDAYGLAGRQTERQTAVRHHLQLFPEDTDRFKVL